MKAAYDGYRDVVQYLHENGADIEATNKVSDNKELRILWDIYVYIYVYEHIYSFYIMY